MLEIKSLYKDYGDKKVLKGISFSTKEGEIVSLLGSNGSGKTTTFKSILGLTDYEGRIRFNGKIINKKKIGYMPEERSLFYDCPIHKQLVLMGRLKGLKDAQIEASLEKWYKKTNTFDFKEKVPPQLSKGNQQKIQMIIAVLHNPDLIVLDEPWTGLDQSNIEIFQKILLELKAKNKLIVLSSHQHQQVQEICDRYLYLKDGNLIINVSKKTLLSDKHKVLEIEGDGNIFPNVKAIRKNNLVKMILSQEDTKKAMTLVMNNPQVMSFSQRPLTIRDLIELKTC